MKHFVGEDGKAQFFIELDPAGSARIMKADAPVRVPKGVKTACFTERAPGK
ncbi:hypothetical protein [Enterovibrio paralichthyis]|uniref:hypothetical protein n=1 Tax=Enterovibrio paralichthyis TaxID=2853805 RepID=UPI001C48572C|nr:hypothetical protein [Enterovibrio paralichthyis]MBV7300917.1 hypothetical protein [Enterovibrio paralichthyis]